MKISRTKTEYFTTDLNENQDETVRLDGEELKRVRNLKYLGSVVDATVDTEKEVNYTILKKKKEEEEKRNEGGCG